MNLYNKMRPRDFSKSQMVGQKAAVSVLKGVIRSKKYPNAFLFTGVRGTGKTSAGRIFARYLNCENPTENGPCGRCKECLDSAPMDIIELDAASHNGVADIKELLLSTQYAPVSQYKVYILDEVHMLSPAAFNALLKTLEEPPEKCFFILCTTESHKVPLTIKSRCMRVEFTRIEEDVIYERIKVYCDEVSKAYEDDALKVIAKSADGGMRDAWSILERFLSEDKITTSDVMDGLGITADESIFTTLAGIVRKDPVMALDAVKDMASRGRSIEIFMQDLVKVLVDIVYVHKSGGVRSLVNTSDYKEGIAQLTQEIDAQTALRYIDELTKVYSGAKESDIDFAVEAAILKLISTVSDYSELEKRVNLLEKEVSVLKATPVRNIQDPAFEKSTQEKKTEPVEKEPANTQNGFFGEPYVIKESVHGTDEEFAKIASDEEMPFDEVPDEEMPFEVTIVPSKEGLEKTANCTETPLGIRKAAAIAEIPEDAPDGEIGEAISLFGNDMNETKTEEMSEEQDDLDEFMFGDVDLFGECARQD